MSFRLAVRGMSRDTDCPGGRIAGVRQGRILIFLLISSNRFLVRQTRQINSSKQLKHSQAHWPPPKGCHIPAEMLMSCMDLAAKLPMLHRLHLAATLGKTMPRRMSSIQGKETCLVLQYHCLGCFFARAQQHNTAYVADKEDGPNISRLAPHLQQEWDHAANAHLGRINVEPASNRKAWWRGGTCKTGQPHKWEAVIFSRTRGASCPYKTGRAVCPCNDLAHNHPEVAAEWDWEANGERSPETVTAGSGFRAAWRCGLCGHRWSATVLDRSHGNGCPHCGRDARRIRSLQPSISSGAPHLLAEWDWQANERCGWHPDLVTLGSNKKVHWVVQHACKLGLVHRWQASPNSRTSKNSGSPFPSGWAVCACNSLAVQCPQAAMLWDYQANGDVTPDSITVQSAEVAWWKVPDGRQWQQKVDRLVNNVRRHEATMKS